MIQSGAGDLHETVPDAHFIRELLSYRLDLHGGHRLRIAPLLQGVKHVADAVEEAHLIHAVLRIVLPIKSGHNFGLLPGLPEQYLEIVEDASAAMMRELFVGGFQKTALPCSVAVGRIYPGT